MCMYRTYINLLIYHNPTSPFFTIHGLITLSSYLPVVGIASYRIISYRKYATPPGTGKSKEENTKKSIVPRSSSYNLSVGLSNDIPPSLS